MAGCNDNCNCLLEAVEDTGIALDGLGSAAQPYSIGLDADRHIPISMTMAEREALSLGAGDVGLIVTETDRARAFLWAGAVLGWQPVAPDAYAVAFGGAMTAGAGTYQDFGTVTVGPGVWTFTAKCYITTTLGSADATDESRDDYAVRILAPATAEELDVSVATADLGHPAPSPATYLHQPFALQRLHRTPAGDAFKIQVRRGNTAMTSSVNWGKFQATRVGFTTSV